MDTREVTLSGKDGTVQTINVGPKAPNLDQVKVGPAVRRGSTDRMAWWQRGPFAPQRAASLSVRSRQATWSMSCTRRRWQSTSPRQRKNQDNATRHGTAADWADPAIK